MSNVIFKNIFLKVILILLFCILYSHAKPIKNYPRHWQPHLINVKSGQDDRATNLELIEFLNTKKKNRPILLFVPGYFQNSYSWDLLPEENISIVDYIQQKYSFHVFSLNTNGIGNSTYIKKSNIDDIAIDDISYAIEYLFKKYGKKPIYVFGHSNGAITLQAYLSGLTRGSKGNYFNATVAFERQKRVKAAALSAGNVCMTDGEKDSFLEILARLGHRMRLLNTLFDWLNAEILTKYISPTTGPLGDSSIAYNKLWKFLYHRENVSVPSIKALYDKTVEGASVASLFQYSDGILGECVRNTSGEMYQSGLANINIPIFQSTYELDPLAPPRFTYTDSYSYIGSHIKEFIVFPNQGHEDFMMNAALHQNLDWHLTRMLKSH